MARSSPFAPLLLALALAGCAVAAPVPAPPSAAPVPKNYTCEQNRAALEDFRKLPPSSVLRVWIDDYRIERKALRAFHELPEPPPCP